MTDRRKSIIDAAQAVFLRYGFARTTMADIAKATGLSRPTLYASFPDKAEIFRAVLESMVTEELAALQAEVAAHEGFAARMAYLSEKWTLDGYDLVAANPDAKDMFDMSFAVVRESYAAFEALLAALIADAIADPARRAEAQRLARMSVAAMKGFKDIAEDREDLQGMIRSLVGAVAAVVEGRHAPR